MDFRRPVSDGPSESIGYIVYILDDYFNILFFYQPINELFNISDLLKKIR